MVVHPGNLVGESGRRLEHHQPEQQQIVVVDEVPARLSVGVVGVDTNHVVRELGETWKLLLEDSLNRNVGVDVARVDVPQGLLLGESSLSRSNAEGGAREAQEILGIAFVENGEVTGKAGRGAELTQKPVAGCVKRPAVDTRACGPDEPLGTREHLVRGAPRERQQENTIRTNASPDQVGDTVHKCSRLTRAGACNDEERTIGMRGGGGLFPIQLGRECLVIGRRAIALARTVDAGDVRHRREASSGEPG